MAPALALFFLVLVVITVRYPDTGDSAAQLERSCKVSRGKKAELRAASEAALSRNCLSPTKLFLLRLSRTG